VTSSRRLSIAAVLGEFVALNTCYCIVLHCIIFEKKTSGNLSGVIMAC